MKKVLLSSALFLISFLGFSQTKGISYQAVIIDPNPIQIPGTDITAQPYVSKEVWVRFGIYAGTTLQYEELHKTKTDEYGLVNLIIGGGVNTGKAGTFTSLSWDGITKSILTSVSFDQGGRYTDVSNQKLNYVPYTLLAETAVKLAGVLPIASGGTGATNAIAARTNLGLGNVDNTSDADKPVSIATLAILDVKESLANKSTNIIADSASSVKYPSVKAIKDYIDARTSSANNANLAAKATALETPRTINGVPFDGSANITIPVGVTPADASSTTKGLVQLAGDLSGTAAAPVIAANSVTTAKIIDGAVTTGKLAVGAVNTAQVADGAVTDAKIATVSGSKVTGNIAGNAATATLATSATTATSANTATKLTTARTINGTPFDGTADITITTSASTLSGTIAIANGGTGATTAAAARTNLGLVIGTDVLAERTFGTAANSAVTDFVAATEKGANNGVATLGVNGKIPSTQIPAISFQNVNVVNSDATMTAISGAQVGSIAIRTDNNNNYVLSALPATTLSNWIALATPLYVSTINGIVGPNVNLTTNDVPEGNSNKYYTDARVRSAISASGPLSYNASTGNFSMTAASASANGYVSSADWATFNNKQTALTAGVDYATPAGNITGNAANVTGIVSIANGGTGSSTAAGALVSLGAEASANKSNDILLDGASTTKFPTFKAIKDYVDQQSANAGVADNSITSAKINGNLAVLKGGTGASTAAGARTNLGLVIGTDVMAANATTALTGDVTGSGNGSFATTLAASGVSSGTYGSSTAIPVLTVDSKGRVTAASTVGIIAGVSNLAYSTTGSSNGGTISGTTLTLTAADASNPGLLSTGAQTIAGAKTFSSDVTATNFLGNATTATTAGNITATSNTTLTSLANLNTVGTITSGTWSATEIAIAKGGTGATTSADARTNLGLAIGTDVMAANATTTLTGDVTGSGNGSFVTTLAESGVSSGTYGSSTAIPTFTVDSKGRLTAASTVGITAGVNSLNYTSTTSYANGGTISGTTLTLTAADANNPGLISTGAQTIAGAKTFNNDIIVNGDISVGRGPKNISTNTALGRSALSLNTGAENVAVGFFTLFAAATQKNTVVGYQAKRFGNGDNNVAIGHNALYTNSGSNNTVVGYESLNTSAQSTGSNNVVVGDNSGSQYGNVSNSFISNISNGVLLGSGIKTKDATSTNEIAIGYNVIGNGSNTVTIGNASNTANYFRGDINLTGNVNGGTWSGTTISPAFGGTGLTSPGTSGNVLTSNGTGWVSSALPVSGVSTLAYSTTGASNGGTISGTTLTLAAANGSNPGLVSTGVQTFAGAKTFNSDATFNGITVGAGAGSQASNAVLGKSAMTNNVGGFNTVAVGFEALKANINSNYNTAVGSTALSSNNGADANTAVGFAALTASVNGGYNTAVGSNSLATNSSGSLNTALGNTALYVNTSGGFNTAVGNKALFTNTTGSYNTAIGHEADVASVALTNATAIGNGAVVNASNRIQLGNANVTSVVTSGTISATGFTGPLTGNASTATKLAATKNINGIAFDGSADITIAANSNTLTGTTLASNVTASSLTSVGTITSGTWSGTEIAIAKGGTGATTAADARTNLGLVIGTDVMSANFTTTLTGDVTGAGNGSFATTLAASGVNSGTYGSSTAIPTFTVDSKGRLTAASTVGITAGVSTLAYSTTGSSNGGTISGTTLTLAAADVSNPGLISTGAQTIAGAKTFTNTATFNTDISVNGLSVGRGAGAVASNAAFGATALNANTSGNYNVAVGSEALQRNTTGSVNVALGAATIDYITTGNNNTAVGGFAGRTYGPNGGATGNNTSMNNGILLGYDARPLASGGTDEVVIGMRAIGNGSNTVTLGNSSNTKTFLTGDLSLTGNITSGIWSATEVAIAKGGTGATTAAGARTNLGLGSLATNSTIANADVASGAAIAFSKLNISKADITSLGIQDGLTAGSGISLSSGTISVTGLTASNLSSSAGITVGQLATSTTTLGSTTMTLGGTVTSVTGLTSITSTGFTGELTGNASTATTLATSRNINGVAFNGSADITVTADAGTLSGTTLKSTVTTSSLSSVGTITSGTWSGSVIGSNVGGAGTVSGILKANGSGVVSAAVAGTDYQAPYANLTNIGSISNSAGYLKNVGTGTFTYVGSITDADLSTITTAGKVSNTATTATSANTANAIVARDASGNFTAGTITGTLSGTATTATNIAGGTVGAIPYQTASGTTALLAGNTTSTVMYLTSSGNGTNSTAPAWATLNAVPYTGATGAVNLGAYDLTVNGLTIGKGNTGDNTNTAIGASALQTNTSGVSNTAVGYKALKTNNGDGTTGSFNAAFGSNSMEYNTTGSFNAAFGPNTLTTNTSGARNSAFGNGALRMNTTGKYNVGFGYSALFGVTTAIDNTAIGSLAGYGLTTGNRNTFIGSNAGAYFSTGFTSADNNTTGFNSVLIGYDVRPAANGDDNEIVISGYNGTPGTTPGTIGLGTNTTLIGNSSTTTARIMGDLTLPRTTTSTSTTSGALKVSGGVGIVENLNVGGTTTITGATTLIGAATISNTTASSSSTTGALKVGGGVGIVGNANIGGTLGVSGAATLASSTITGNETIGGTLGVTGATSLAALTTTGAATISITTNSTSTSTGALIVRGGVGIASDVKIGGTIEIDGGSPGAGKVLTSDATGVASWQNSGGTITTLSATGTATSTASYIIFTGSTASQTITIPSAVTLGAGRELTIKNVASVSVSIASAGGYLIQDSSTLTATSAALGIEPSNNWMKLVSDGTNWYIMRGLF